MRHLLCLLALAGIGHGSAVETQGDVARDGLRRQKVQQTLVEDGTRGDASGNVAQPQCTQKEPLTSGAEMAKTFTSFSVYGTQGCPLESLCSSALRPVQSSFILATTLFLISRVSRISISGSGMTPTAPASQSPMDLD